MQLLLATRNREKLREVRASLPGLNLSLVTLESFPQVPDAREDGETFRENALLKAKFYSESSGLPSLADDSGLCVSVLECRPGVYSARLGANDEQRIQRLLAALKEREAGFEAVSRKATFECALCLCTGSQVIQVEGRVSGWIIDEPRGREGFGYDPIFFYPPTGMTFAQMRPAEKNRVSHRARALSKLKPLLLDWLDEADILTS